MDLNGHLNYSFFLIFSGVIRSREKVLLSYTYRMCCFIVSLDAVSGFRAALRFCRYVLSPLKINVIFDNITEDNIAV